MASELLESITSGTFPQLVQVTLEDGTNLCAGSIIAPQLILTAAICVFQGVLASNLTVVAGRFSSALESKTEQIRKVRQIIIHENYIDVAALEYNLALLVLDEDLTFTKAVRNLALPTKYSTYSGKGIVAGWKTHEKDMSATEVSIMERDYCQAFWNETLQSQFEKNVQIDRILCAGKEGEGPCFGDEGQPLICKLNEDLKGQEYLCGIVSIGDENCNTGLVIDLRKYQEWILAQFLTLSLATAEAPSMPLFKCSNGALLDKSLECDGYDDCGDGSDEDIDSCSSFRFFSHTEEDSEVTVDHLENYHPCYTNSSAPSVYKYVPATSICNGLEDCRLGSDEENCEDCKDGAFHCKNDQCVPPGSKCNGIAECEDGSDELMCTAKLNSVDECSIRCRDSLKCISVGKICDGKDDCGDGSDEQCDMILKRMLSKIKGSKQEGHYTQLLSNVF